MPEPTEYDWRVVWTNLDGSKSPTERKDEETARAYFRVAKASLRDPRAISRSYRRVELVRRPCHGWEVVDTVDVPETPVE